MNASKPSFWLAVQSPRYLLLLILFSLLIFAAVTNHLDSDLLSGLVGAILGSLATIYASETERTSRAQSEIVNGLNALREEVLFNKKLLEIETDQKRINVLVSAWREFAPYSDRINKGAR